MMTLGRVFGFVTTLIFVSACGGGGGGDGGAGRVGDPGGFSVSTTTTGTGSGTISPTSRSVTQGSTTSFTISPAPGSSIGSVSGCGGSLSGSTYTTGPINGDCTVTASFAAVPVEVREYCVTNAVELESALSLAGKAMGTATIRLSATRFSGTFRLDIVTGNHVKLEGGYNSTCSSKAVTDETIIDGMRQGVVLVVIADAEARFEVRDLTITQGRNARISSSGAGLYILGPEASVLIERLVAIQNDSSGAEGGGGLWAQVGELDMFDSQFIDNRGYIGAGVWLSCLRCGVFATSFTGNVADEYGGGLATHYGDVVVEDSFFEFNTATTGNGGAMRAFAGEAFRLSRNSFASNSAAFGGALDLFAGSQAELTENYFVDNQATFSGGALVLGSSLGAIKVVNNVIERNTAVQDGGGIFFNSGEGASSIEIVNNTVIQNNAGTQSGGIGVRLLRNTDQVSIINNAVSHNEAPQFRNFYVDNDADGDFIASPVTATNNAFDGADSYGAEIGQPIDASNILIDASAYVDLAGGDYRPSAGSSLINAGVQTDGVPETDFTGATRDAQPDIGAYEYRGD